MSRFVKIILALSLAVNLSLASLMASGGARDGLLPSGPGSVAARDYGAPGKAALDAAISAIGASERVLLVTPGTWPITANLTIPANLTLHPEPGAVLAVANGVTLTISGQVDAGDYQIFSCAGTGKVAISDANIRWFGILADGTDQTTALTKLFTDNIPATTMGFFRIPNNVKFQMQALAPVIPVGVILQDDSVINGWNSGPRGYIEKTIGYSEQGQDGNDFVYQIGSGQHPCLILNNFGTALKKSDGTPSDSARARLASIIFAAGNLKPSNQGTNPKRNVGALTFGRMARGPDKWSMNLRRLAPWEAISPAPYELWGKGRRYAAKAYCLSDNKIYQTVAGGTSGPKAPTQTSGTVTDGGVAWTYVDFADNAVFTINEDGRIATNNYAPTYMVDFNQGDRETGDYTVGYRARGISREVYVFFKGTDGTGASVNSPLLLAGTDGSLAFRNAANSADLLRMSGNYVIQNGTRKADTYRTDNSATPDVAGVNTLVLNYPSAVNITDFINGEQDQEIQVINISAAHRPTIKAGRSIKLTRGSDIALTQYSVVTLRRLTAGLAGSIWIEVSASIK